MVATTARHRARKQGGRPRALGAAFGIAIGLLILVSSRAIGQHTFEPSAAEKALALRKALGGRQIPDKWALWPKKMREVWKSQVIVDNYAKLRKLKRPGSHYIVVDKGSGSDTGPTRLVAVAGGLLNPESRRPRGGTKVATLMMHGMAVYKYAEIHHDQETGDLIGGYHTYVCPKLRIEVSSTWGAPAYSADSLVEGIVGYLGQKLAELNKVLDRSLDNTITITCTMKYYKPLVLNFQTKSDVSSIHITGTVNCEELDQPINYASVEVKYQGATSGKKLSRAGKYDITLKTENSGNAMHEQIDLALTPEMYRLRLEWGVRAGDHKGWEYRYYVIPKSVVMVRYRGVVYRPDGQLAVGAHVNCKSKSGPRVKTQTRENGVFELHRISNKDGFMGMSLPIETFRIIDEDAEKNAIDPNAMSAEDLEWAMKLADARQEVLNQYKGKIDQKMFNKLKFIYKGINVYDVLTSDTPDPREYAKLKKLLQDDLKGKELEIGLKLLTEPAKRVFGTVSTIDKYWNQAKSMVGIKTKKTPQVNQVANNLKLALGRIAEFKAIVKEIK